MGRAGSGGQECLPGCLSSRTLSGTHPGSKKRVEEMREFAMERGWPTDGELLPPIVYKDNSQ